MRKYVLSLLLLLAAATAFCQKKSKVNLISSTRTKGDKINGMDVIKVYNGVWTQDASRMRSDSAYFYQGANALDAFGHVNINQGDTLNIYSDKLNYNGNTKTAILTDNVKMVDREATLTTNYFTYNTGTRIGTYINGGKLVSKTNTLTSTNGYYFAATHDAYFRYDVVCKTSDALINTDTMRYNSKTRVNYFYGPTTIYGTKDKDTLLTDYGTYDTKSEEALFTKNNLYKQDTKSLVGDTLFYDRLKGYGRAVKHVTFNDNEQKITIKGGLGTYNKKDDMAVVTRDPYIILIAEDKDTTNKSDSLKKQIPLPKPDSLVKKSTVQSAKVAANKPPAKPRVNPGIKTSPAQNKDIDTASKKLTMPTLGSFSRKLPARVNSDSVNKKLTMPAISSFSRKIPGKINADSANKILSAQSKKINKPTQNKINAAARAMAKTKLDTNEILSPNTVSIKDTGKVKRDSVYMSADTIKTRILTFKELNIMQEEERRSHIRDTSKAAKKPSMIYKKSPKVLEITPPAFPKDTSFLHRDYFGKPKPVVAKTKKATDIAQTKPKKNVKVDSTFLDRPVLLKDTARVRIIMAFHSAKIFKSDLQAIADSIFYSNSDSTIRCYTKPMVWTQGSQLSGDTINLILKNKKLEKMDMFPSAFIVNVEKYDSTTFNQIGGKRMRGFFKDSKLSRVYFDGNVESIYFVRDSTTKLITDMQRSLSSRMRVYLKNNEVTNMAFLTKPDHRYIPIKLVKDDEKILKGFIWKPKDRPVSKESILPSRNKKSDTTKTHVAGEPRPKKMYSDKAGGKKQTDVKAAKDSTVKTPDVKAGQDTTLKKLPAAKAASDTTATDTVKKPQDNKSAMPAINKFRNLHLLKAKKDSVQNTGNDTSKVKPPQVASPAIQIKKDTTGKK